MALPSVLIVIGQLTQVGGTEHHLALVMPKLAAQGFSISIYTLQGAGEMGRRLQEQGVEIIEPLSARREIMGLIRAAWQLRRLVSTRRPTIVHYFLPEAYLVGAVSLYGLAIPHQIMSRRSLNTYQKKYFGARWIERLFHGRMTRVLANSRAVYTQLLDEGVPTAELALLYNGVKIPTIDKTARTKYRAELGIDTEAVVFLIVANLIPYKGHVQLIEALNIAKSRLPAKWILVCCGRDDGIGESLRGLASSCGIASQIIWTGARNDARELWAIADIGINVSLEEGFSNAVLEGMAAGVPMLVTDVGGNGEAVIDGECGWVVKANSTSEIADTIAALANDSRMRQRMGAAAKSRVEKLFSLDTCVDQYASLYSSLTPRA